MKRERIKQLNTGLDNPRDLRPLISEDRLAIILKYVKLNSDLIGDNAEFGVYKGGTAIRMNEANPNTLLHLFDTFSGIPFQGENDLHLIGDFKGVDLAYMNEQLKDKNVIFHVGLFPDTTKGLEDKIYSVVHIDADQYQSTKDALEYFYPRTVKGGVLIFDDYEWPMCPGVKKAIDEFLQDKTEKVQVETPYQAVLIKI